MMTSTMTSSLLSPSSLPGGISNSISRSTQQFAAAPPAFLTIRRGTNPRRFRSLVVSSSSSSSSSESSTSGFGSDENSSGSDSSKKSSLASLVQEIEPFDVSLIQKEVPPTTVDAVKRTISGMLGLLPSDRFQVSIEALWEPLYKLLVSSMMTGYTLHNAEYRLTMERNLDMSNEDLGVRRVDDSSLGVQEVLFDSANVLSISGLDDLGSKSDKHMENLENGIKGLGEMSPEAQDYIIHLQSRLSSVKKELNEVKRKSAALQMQQFVGEEKNELLNYLRSLEPEKVAELSEPTSPEVRETINSVVHGLLATLSPKMQSKAPPSDNSAGPLNVGSEDCAELLENASLQFQPLISLTRDYLARMIFWCMLLGHYIRGLEYRMELTQLLSMPDDA